MQHVQDAVMANSYQVLTGAWPGVQVGNYDDVNTDGAVGTTGWMLVQDANPAGPYDPPSVTSNQFPRLDVHKLFGGGEFVHPSGTYLGFAKKASGTVDSPYLYGLALNALSGYPGFIPGHGQKNFYKSGPPDETLWEAGTRINRHTVESIIESLPNRNPAPPGCMACANEFRLVPWLEMAYVSWSGNEYRQPSQVQELLAMLRGKNVPELIYWTELYGIQNGYTLKQVWDETSRVRNAVYAPTVQNYTRLIGIAPPGNPFDTARLEFTLRHNGAERTVDIVSRPKLVTAEPEAPTFEQFTELSVDFTLPISYDDGGVNAAPGFDLFIECSSSRSTVQGTVFMWDWDQGEWVTVIMNDINPTNWYNAPITPSDNRYRARVSGSLGTGYPALLMPDPLDSSRCKAKVKLVQHEPSNLTFSTRYDLVQIIPNVPPGTASAMLMGTPALTSDVNYDQVIDESDLTNFVDQWLEAGPAADLNMDESVDLIDLDTFVEAYLTGG